MEQDVPLFAFLVELFSMWLWQKCSPESPEGCSCITPLMKCSRNAAQAC